MLKDQARSSQRRGVNPAGNCMFKVKNRNTRARCEICSKLTIKTYVTPGFSVSIINFEQVNAGWEGVIHSPVIFDCKCEFLDENNFG